VQRVLAVNVLGTVLCCREAVRRMSTRHGGSGGSVVLVSSAASRLGSPGEYRKDPPAPRPLASSRRDPAGGPRARASGSTSSARASSRRGSTPAAASPTGWSGWARRCPWAAPACPRRWPPPWCGC
jgi:NAD(P)-dependent dehydrogenase (short-subunit alcohol dehydrogenase family)